MYQIYQNYIEKHFKSTSQYEIKFNVKVFILKLQYLKKQRLRHLSTKMFALDNSSKVEMRQGF